MQKQIAKHFSKPSGFWGSVLLNSMNKTHAKLITWGLSHLEIGKNDTVLDIGCGGGLAVSLMAQKSGDVYGVDYSHTAVKKAAKKNKQAIRQGRVHIQWGDVQKLPFEDNTFDVVTAFETIYFWPDIAQNFKEVLRVVKPGGAFMPVFQAGDKEKELELEQTVPHMKIRGPAEVGQLLGDAGFVIEATHTNDDHSWQDSCIICKKPQ